MGYLTRLRKWLSGKSLFYNVGFYWAMWFVFIELLPLLSSLEDIGFFIRAISVCPGVIIVGLLGANIGHGGSDHWIYFIILLGVSWFSWTVLTYYAIRVGYTIYKSFKKNKK